MALNLNQEISIFYKIREFFRGKQGESGISAEEVLALREQWDAELAVKIEDAVKKRLPDCDCARCKARWNTHLQTTVRNNMSELASALDIRPDELSRRLLCSTAEALAQQLKQVQRSPLAQPQVAQPSENRNIVSAVQAVPTGSVHIKSTGRIEK